MHGLINRTIECFTKNTYGTEMWLAVAETAGLGLTEFEAMLSYDDASTEALLGALSGALGVPNDAVLEDIGTYLVSHKEAEGVRRLLRFAGVDFIEFLHSLDDLPERARLAVPDLDLPALELCEHSSDRFSLSIEGRMPGFGAVLIGVLRAMADDYGALVILEPSSVVPGAEVIDIQLIETAFARDRGFELGARAG